MKDLQSRKRLNGATVSAVLILSAAVISAPTYANTDEQKRSEIAARSDRSDTGFGDSVVELKMVLRIAAGKETTREHR